MNDVKVKVKVKAKAKIDRWWALRIKFLGWLVGWLGRCVCVEGGIWDFILDGKGREGKCAIDCIVLGVSGTYIGWHYLLILFASDVDFLFHLCS